MESSLLIVVIVVLALALVVAVGGAVLFSRRGAADQSSALINQLAQLGGRLQSMQDTQTQLNRTMEERLEVVSKRLGDGLNEHSQRTGDVIKQVHERLAVIDVAQKNLTDLSTQVVGLQDILSNKQARGAFGEIQLNDLVSDMLPPNAFEFQATLSNGKRADCLLRLPNPPGSIVIDAKFPLESFRALHGANDEAARVQAGRQFSADVIKHVKDISEKYIVPGDTAESALMFLPSEAVYAELHTNFRNVIEESHRRRVWIVSPSTLMATLMTVRAVLKDASMREQAGVIQAEVLKLLDDVLRLDKRVASLQTHFGQAQKDIGEIQTSTGKIARRAERIEEIQVSADSPATDLPIAAASATQPKLELD